MSKERFDYYIHTYYPDANILAIITELTAEIQACWEDIRMLAEQIKIEQDRG